MTVPSFLSTANDANVGFTSSNYFDINLTPASQVPQNTLFTGMLMIQDPNDSTFLCVLPFSFLYGNQLASITQLSRNHFSIYPNPSSGFVHIESAEEEEGKITVIDPFGRTIKTEELKNGKANLYLEKEGIYFIQVSTNHGQSTENISILQ